MSEEANAITRRYDALSREVSCGGALSHALIEKGHVCLDLGCGKGFDVLRMASLAGSNGQGIGVDISDGMIAVAKENAEKLGIRNVRFIRCPLERIELGDATVDVVLSNCTINHSLQQDLVWQEIARVLKPGGRFVVSDIYALEEIPPAYRLDPEAVAACWGGAVTREAYLNHVLGAGLTGIEVVEESAPYRKGEVEVASFTLRGTRPLPARMTEQ